MAGQWPTQAPASKYERYYVPKGSLSFQKNELLLVSFIRFFSDINKPYLTAEINPVLEEVFTQK